MFFTFLQMYKSDKAFPDINYFLGGAANPRGTFGLGGIIGGIGAGLGAGSTDAAAALYIGLTPAIAGPVDALRAAPVGTTAPTEVRRVAGGAIKDASTFTPCKSF